MRGLERRLETLEGRSLQLPYAYLGDAELAARFAEVAAEMATHGVLVPDGFLDMPYRQQKAWIASLRADCGE